MLPLLLIAPFITMRILNTEADSGGCLFALEDGRRTYTYRLREYLGDEVFLEVAKAVGGFQLSIRKWRDGRDGGSKTLARDHSAGVCSQRAELRRVQEAWFRDEEPSPIVRETVELLLDCRVVQGPDLDDGPLQVELGREPADFLVAMQTTALVAHVEGKIDLELLLRYMAACFYGVLVTLGCLFKLFYLDVDGNPQKNALGLHVLKYVLKSQLVEFKLIVFNGMVIVQRQTETVPLGINSHVGRFQAVANRNLPPDWKVDNFATADDDDDGLPPRPRESFNVDVSYRWRGGTPSARRGGFATTPYSHRHRRAVDARSSVAFGRPHHYKRRRRHLHLGWRPRLALLRGAEVGGAVR